MFFFFSCSEAQDPLWAADLARCLQPPTIKKYAALSFLLALRGSRQLARIVAVNPEEIATPFVTSQQAD